MTFPDLHAGAHESFILDPDRARHARTKSSWRPPENGVDDRRNSPPQGSKKEPPGRASGQEVLIPLVTRIPRRLHRRSLMEGASVRRVRRPAHRRPLPATPETARLRPQVPAPARSLCSRSRKPFAESPAWGPVPLGGGCDICRLGIRLGFVYRPFSGVGVDICRLCVVPFPCPIPGPSLPFTNLRRRVAQAKRTGATVLQHHQEPGGCSTTGAGRARHTGEHRKGSNACLWAERVHPRADFGSRSGSWRLACFLTRSSRAHVWPSRRCRRRCIRAQRPVSLWCLIPRSSDVAAVAPCAARRDVAFRLVVSRRHSQPFAITSSAVCSTTLPAANRRRGGKRVTWCLLDRRLRC